MSIQVDGLDSGALLRAGADEVPEVAQRDLGLAAGLEGLVAAGAELLDGVLEADAQVVGGDAEDLADAAGDARAVGVHVVEGLELRCDLRGQARGERVWDLLEHVGCC